MSVALNNPARALLALFAGASAIGLAPIFVRLSELGPVATAFYRLLLALPVLGVWLLFENRRATTVPRADRKLLLAAGLFFAADLAVWHWSIRFTTVANATLLANSAPLFVTLASWLWLGERIRSRFLLGMAIAFSGAVLFAIDGGKREPEPDARYRRCPGPVDGSILRGIYNRRDSVARASVHRAGHVLERGGLLPCPVAGGNSFR